MAIKYSTEEQVKELERRLHRVEENQKTLGVVSGLGLGGAAGVLVVIIFVILNS